MYDLLIKSGTIVDGTRFPRYVADIAIKDGRIAHIGHVDPETARETLDAEGLIIAPGHIDCHTHYDAQIHWDPYCSNSGENGITTVVTGNCGFGFAPCRSADRERYMRMMENTEQVPYVQMKAALPWTWETFPEWFDHLKGLPKGVNMMMYVPLNPLLIYVMGVDAAKTERPGPSDLEEMKRLIREAMDCGACGIALSHLGEHNTHVDWDGTPMPTDLMHRDDAIALASVLRERDSGTIQLLSLLPGAFDERDLACDLYDASGRPVILNVFTTSNMMPGMAKEGLAWLAGVNAAGKRIYGQTLAQRGWSEFNLVDFNLNDHLPEWAAISKLKSLDEKFALLRDEQHRALMKERYDPMLLMAGSGALDALTVTSVNDVDALAAYVSRTLGDIAAEEDKHPLDVLFDICLESEGWADFRTPPLAGSDPAENSELISGPNMLAGTSDGGAHSKFFIGGHWPTELLVTLGKEHNLLSLEELHYRFSWQPARVMGLTDRGALLEGMAADIIIYDFDALATGGTQYEIRHDMPAGDWRRYLATTGYRWIIVNGELTFEDGKPSGGLPGEILRNNLPVSATDVVA
ncbi:MAG: amidohydrolase family protein [Pseudomonadota bacterium]